MKSHAFAAALAWQAYLSAGLETDVGNVLAPGRAERMFPRQAASAPRDFGTFEVDCAGAEGACNNACYYIRCHATQDPNNNLITYTGPNGNGNGEDRTNRQESGCRVENPRAASGSSVCTNFPFSQKFSDPTSTTHECDEWPPAVSQQQLPWDQKLYRNSLRCIPGSENRLMGTRLVNYIHDAGTYPNRPIAGAMVRDDYFRVDFLANIASADQNRVPYCLGTTPSCGNDGMQIGLTDKIDARGRLSSPYNDGGNDNRYALQNTQYADLGQCSVEFTRNGDNIFDNIVLFGWDNQGTTSSTCGLPNNGDECTVPGLPNDLLIRRTGAFGTTIEFEYAPGPIGQNVNTFEWNSDSEGNGRGPATDAGAPSRYCRVDTRGNAADIQCWFPCYQHANGQ